MTNFIVLGAGVMVTLGIVASLWFLACNDRTLQQRRRIIHAFPVGDPRFWPATDEFESVSYDRHLWSLFFFRDPMKLYGPVTRKAMAEKAP